jgi:hypothetical protein
MESSSSPSTILVAGDPDAVSNFERRPAVVARDDDDLDPRRVTLGDGIGDLGPRWVEEAHEAEEAELLLSLFAGFRHVDTWRERPPRYGENPQPRAREGVQSVQDLGPVRGRELVPFSAAGCDRGRAGEHRFGRALDVHPERFSFLVDRRHELEGGVEVKLPATTTLP